MKKPLLTKNFFNDSAFGWDGLSTFIFSNIIILLTLGMTFFWLLLKTLLTAVNAQTRLIRSAEISPPVQAILIAGLCLKNDQLTEEFITRLQRVVCSVSVLKNKPHIIILGGITGGNTISEAQAGANYLIRNGISGQQIILEDESRHTLENLKNARSILNQVLQTTSENKIAAQDVAIISSRYHLYRILTLARDMNMILHPVASESSYSFSLRMFIRIVKEAYYLHWYWSGKLWSRLTTRNLFD